MEQKLELELKEYRGIEIDMLQALKGRTLYVHEGDTNTPFSGTLEQFGENFLKFVDVTTYSNHFLRVADMREALENDRWVSEQIPALYKNKNDIATLVDLYQE